MLNKFKLFTKRNKLKGVNLDIHSTARFKLKRLSAISETKIKIDNKAVVNSKISLLKQNASILVGENSTVGFDTNIMAFEKIEIGKNVMISWGCTLIDSDTHPIHFEERQKDFDILYNNKPRNWEKVKSAPIKVCDNAWIGFNSIILKGVTIGEGAVIGAGSVVTKDVEPYTVVAGNPAKFIKHIEKDL